MKQRAQKDKVYEIMKLLGIILFMIILGIAWIVWSHLGGVHSSGEDSNSSVSYTSLEEGSLAATFLDAGKADAIIIHTKNSTVLIDTGLKRRGDELIQFIKAQGIETIDYMILTHFDKDHVGGAAKVINEVKVNHIITSDYFKDSDEVKEYLEACDKANITPQILKDTMRFTLDNVIYTIYPHIASTYAQKASNNSSLILSVEHGENRMLFTGDANNLRVEEFLTQQETNFRYQLLKVPYHGRYMECLFELINTIRPQYAVITSSEEDMEDKKTVQLLKDVDSEVLLTREGMITIVSDGKTLDVEQ